MTLNLEDLQKAGAKIPGLGRAGQAVVDALACEVVGILSKAPNQEVRRRSLEKARRMLGVR